MPTVGDPTGRAGRGATPARSTSSGPVATGPPDHMEALHGFDTEVRLRSSRTGARAPPGQDGPQGAAPRGPRAQAHHNHPDPDRVDDLDAVADPARRRTTGPRAARPDRRADARPPGPTRRDRQTRSRRPYRSRRTPGRS